MPYLTDTLVGYHQLLTDTPVLHSNGVFIPDVMRRTAIASSELSMMTALVDLEYDPSPPPLWCEMEDGYQLGLIYIGRHQLVDEQSFVYSMRSHNICVWQQYLDRRALTNILRRHSSFSRFFTNRLIRSIRSSTSTGNPRHVEELRNAADSHAQTMQTDTSIWPLARLLELLASLITALTHGPITFST
jgi:hypothetical protein